jgi:hypothetical protein
MLGALRQCVWLQKQCWKRQSLVSGAIPLCFELPQCLQPLRDYGSRSSIVAGLFSMLQRFKPWNGALPHCRRGSEWIGRVLYEFPARIFRRGCRAVSIRLWWPSLTSV